MQKTKEGGWIIDDSSVTLKKNPYVESLEKEEKEEREKKGLICPYNSNPYTSAAKPIQMRNSID